MRGYFSRGHSSQRQILSRSQRLCVIFARRLAFARRAY